MMKKLKILGMELDNYTVWEAMGKVEGFHYEYGGSCFHGDAGKGAGG